MRKIVIAPNEAQANLYNAYRKDNPFVDVKFFSKNALLRKYYYQYDENAVIYLIKKLGCEYNFASDLLEEIKKIKLSRSEDKEVQELIAYRDELIKENLLFIDEYLPHLLKTSEIDVYFYSQKDKELLNVLEGTKYNFVSLPKKKDFIYREFNNNNDELTFAFNKISELISKGVKPSDISLFGLSEDDELSFFRLKKNFHLIFNNAYPKTLIDKKYILKFLLNIEEVGFEKAYELALNEEDETLDEFKVVVEKYHLSELSVKQQVSLYRGLFDKKRIIAPKFVDAIEVVSKPIAKENGYLFIVNFIQGKFPPLSKDNQYLSDLVKAKNNLITSEDKNSANLEEYSNYLRQNANIFISSSKHSYSQKYQPSQFVKSLGIEPIKEETLPDYYSLDEAKIAYTNFSDLRRNYLNPDQRYFLFKNAGIDLDYRSYDYQYSGTSNYASEYEVKLSYSGVDEFANCQFKYYLSRVLKLSEFNDNVYSNMGKVAHYIFEHIDESKTFDQLFDEGVSKIDTFGTYDWVYFPKLKREFLRAYNEIKQFEDNLANKKIVREVKLKDQNSNGVKLDKNITLDGRIDKLITFGDNLQYFAIVDYKTSFYSFNEKMIDYGFDLQLPTYALIAKNYAPLASKTLAGLFIQPVLAIKNLETLVDHPKKAKPILTGPFLDDINVISELDPTLKVANESNHITNCKIVIDKDSKQPRFSKGKAKSAAEFNHYVEVADKYYHFAAEEIRKDNFVINPKIRGNSTSCERCPYRDICFRDSKALQLIGGDEDGD